MQAPQPFLLAMADEPRKEPPTAPLIRGLQAWVQRSQGRGLEGWSRKEVFLIGGALMCLPILWLVLYIHLAFDPGYFSERRRDRVLLYLLAPVMMPVGLCWVITTDLVLPMAQRLRTRRRVLRQAGPAVQAMLRELGL